MWSFGPDHKIGMPEVVGIDSGGVGITIMAKGLRAMMTIDNEAQRLEQIR